MSYGDGQYGTGIYSDSAAEGAAATLNLRDFEAADLTLNDSSAEVTLTDRSS